MPERLKGKTLLSVLVLAFIASAYFWSVLDGKALLTERDLSIFFIPPRIFWTEALKAGEFPLWNPYSYAGHPLFATLQPGVLYPVNVLLLVLPFDLAFNWTIIVHYALAGAFTYALMRELASGVSGSLAAALIFMLSGYLFSVHNVMSTLFSAAWAPLALSMHIRTMRTGSAAYAAAASITLAMMFLGGGIEVLFATILLLLIASAYPSAVFVNGFYKARAMKRAWLFALTLLLFLALSAVQLIPFLELAAQTTRAGGLTFFEATTWSFGLKDFIQFFIPDPYGYGTSNDKYWSNQSWLKTVYLGAAPFMLAIFFFLRRGMKQLPFTLAAIVFLLLSLGRNTPFYQLLYEYVPFIDKIRYPVKFLFVPFLFIAIAAGLGLESLKEGLRQSDRRTSLVIWVFLGLAVLSALALGFLDYFEPVITEMLRAGGFDFPEYNRADINIFNAKRALVFFILSAAALYAAMKARSGELAAVLLIPLLGIDLFFAHNGYYQATLANEYHAKGPVLDFFTKDSSGLFRVYTTPKTSRQGTITLTEGFEAAQGFDIEKEKVSGFGLEHKSFDTGGVEVMKRADFSSVMELLAAQPGPDTTNILTMLNVKYIVSIPEIKSDEWKMAAYPGWSGERAFKIYENRRFLPRHYMVYGYRVIKKPDEYVAALLDKGFDPATSVLLEKDPGAKMEIPGNYSVEVVSYANNSSELKVTTDHEGIFVASESWYPGWKAFVDGVETELLKANLVLRAVKLNAGEHTVRFEYSPASFKTGAAISTAAIVSVIIFFIIRSRRARR
ncbi:hypothetical protein BAC1_01900 [uncultured bacterium]|nr:hypothetical protein BAC1_01900 [uncultured bacterium]